MAENPPMYGFSDHFGRNSLHSGFKVQDLFALIDNAVESAKAQLKKMQSGNKEINIGDMFNMQMMMNHLSQMSEMGTNVVSASNTAVMSMARNLK